MPERSTVTISTRLPRNVADGFAALAALDNRTPSALLRRLVLVHIMTGSRPASNGNERAPAEENAPESGSIAAAPTLGDADALP
jgi:hypothetical protein